MLKVYGRSIEITHKLVDLFFINLAWWIAYYLRFETNFIISQDGLFFWYLKFSILLTFLNYYYFRREGLYGSKRFLPIYEEVLAVIKANFIAFTIFIFITYFLSNYKLSRLFIISHFLISLGFLIAFKFFIRKLLRHFRKSGKNIRYVILIGNNKQIQDYAGKLLSHSEFGVKIKQWFKTENQISQLTSLEFETLGADSVIIGIENKNSSLSDHVLTELNNSLCEVIVLPDLSKSFVGYQIVNIAGTTAILINEPNQKSRSVIVKRLFDIIFSLIGFIFISPLLLLISILIKFTSKGPVFYFLW